MIWPALVTALPYLQAGAAAVGIIGGAQQIFSGNDQKKYVEQQNALERTQAQQQYELGLEYNRVAEQNAIRLAGGMRSEAAMQYWAAQQAMDAGNRNASALLDQGGEIVRLKKREHRQTEGMTRARQAASGISLRKDSDGSASRFRRDLNRANIKERDSITRAFASQAEIARQGGVVKSAELSALAGGSMAGAESVLIAQQDEARLRNMENEFARINAGLNPTPDSSSIFSGIGNIAKGIGGIAGSGIFGGGLRTIPDGGLGTPPVYA